jgi:hypothetical protein
MSRTPTTPKPRVTLADCDFDEQSAVFTRSSEDPRETAAPATEPPPSEELDPSTRARTLRVNAKIEQARAVIAKLDPEGLRARLLRIAMVRRDEVLLTGILRSLQVEREPESQKHATILPPPERKG